MDIRQALTKLAEQVSLAGDDNLPILLNGAANEIEQLQQRNAELAAQVEQLNQRNNELEVMQPSYNLLRNAFYDGACWNESTINNGALALDKNAHEYANEKLAELTPTQYLAEHDREVAARAVADEYSDLLHVVANQYDGNDNTDWSIGANHVFVLFVKEIQKRRERLCRQAKAGDI